MIVTQLIAALNAAWSRFAASPSLRVTFSSTGCGIKTCKRAVQSVRLSAEFIQPSSKTQGLQPTQPIIYTMASNGTAHIRSGHAPMQNQITSDRMIGIGFNVKRLASNIGEPCLNAVHAE